MEKQRISLNKPVLGKGLASLLPPGMPPAPPIVTTEMTAVEVDNRDRHPGISMCSVDEIAPNEFQPRRSFDDQSIEELAQSIRSNGLIQPLIVRKAAQGYQLIAGERRLRAAKLAGLKQVPIVIRRTTDKESLELALIENIQREDLNCLDTALAYYQLIQDFDLKQDDISARVGKDRTSVTNYLRLLKLPVSVQDSLREGSLSFGHGKALLGLEDPVLIERIAKETTEKKWSVRELETQVQRIKNLQQGREALLAHGHLPQDPVSVRFRTIGRDLATKFSTRVHVKGNAAKGKIIIEYFSAEDLERVLSHLLR